MEEDVITEAVPAAETEVTGAESVPIADMETAGTTAAVAVETEAADAKAAARWPDISSFLPGSLWLCAVPVILLLFLWLFYPVILVLICIILALWWLG